MISLIYITAALLIIQTVSAQYPLIATFLPQSNVTKHALIDLDMAEMEVALDDENFAAAKLAYSIGGNSLKSDSIRTIQGFSTSAGTKLKDEPLYEIYKAYWNSETYADDFILAALDGTGAFEGAEIVTRAECAAKGAQYQAIWMYVFHELYDAVNDCDAGQLEE